MELEKQLNKKRLTIGYQGKTATGKSEWLTDPKYIKALGPFQLDPCAPHPSTRPWPTAWMHYHERGLQQQWFGKVWVNPPYDDCEAWFSKAADHGNCLGTCFVRTETIWFFNSIWDRADAVLFVKGRMQFFHIDGTRGKSGSGVGSVIMAYGKNAAQTLYAASKTSIPGKFLRLK